MNDTNENTLLGEAIRNLNMATIILHEIGLTGFADDAENIVRDVRPYYVAEWDGDMVAKRNVEPENEFEYEHIPGASVGVYKGGCL